MTLRPRDFPPISFYTHQGFEVLRVRDHLEPIARRASAMRSRLDPAARIGLSLRSSPDLVIEWCAALAAGLVPCILEYPTTKRSLESWRASVADTVSRCGLAAVISDPEAASSLDNIGAALLAPGDGEELTPTSVDVLDGAILQLSSGTTGHKKGLRFTLDQIASHVSAYNEVLELTPRDCVVSWLPLYHDMGFVACFLMPLLLRVPLVLIDPMTWVRDPGLLFSAIAAHRGTVCFMPNFGFELMARVGRGGGLEQMRLWISCSEPTYADSLSRFSDATGVDPRTISVCYGMAENVFAIAQSRGISVRCIEGRDGVSCGTPIPGTQVREVDGELRVKSAVSVTSYVGTEDVRNADGFYATGDRGYVVDGEVFVAGRVRDIMICAGRKYVLSDLDHFLNRVVPDCDGRGVVLADRDAHVPGTEAPLVLLERPRFWTNQDRSTHIERLRAATGLEALTVHHVPAQFITKTSSGKINRTRTLDDWHRCRRGAAAGGPAANPAAFEREVARLFPDLRLDRPLDDQLDSLGRVALHTVMERFGVRDVAPSPRGDVLSIVFLSDGDWLGFVDDALMGALSNAAGIPVQVEHVCAPPSFVLLRDLVFHDYFMPRDDERDYSAFAAAIRKIKKASLLVVDDMAEYHFPNANDAVYPALSHRFHHDPRADLLALRWATYTANHHRLMRELVWGSDAPAITRADSLADLLAYLDVPAFRIALTERYATYTRDWEHIDPHPDDALASCQWGTSPACALVEFVAARKSTLRTVPGAPQNRRTVRDWPHFCSWLINRDAIDFVVNRYDRFCISGPSSSLPYLETQLAARGKHYRYANTLAVRDDDVDCVLQTGSWGMPTTAKPIFDLMAAAVDRDRPINVPADVAASCPPFRRVR